VKYRDIRSCSLTQLVARFEKATDNGDMYPRRGSRMVWFETQEDPAEKAKRFPKWAGKGLSREYFDELTEEGMQRWFQEGGGIATLLENES